jgi:hypothetical protein
MTDNFRRVKCISIVYYTVHAVRAHHSYTVAVHDGSPVHSSPRWQSTIADASTLPVTTLSHISTDDNGTRTNMTRCDSTVHTVLALPCVALRCLALPCVAKNMLPKTCQQTNPTSQTRPSFSASLSPVRVPVKTGYVRYSILPSIVCACILCVRV